MVTEITKATMHRIDQGKICALANAGWSVEAISLDVRLGRQRAARYCVCGNDFGYI